MRLADLSPERRAWLASALYDHLLEKHEGPESWSWELAEEMPPDERPEFLMLDGYEVLLPVPAVQHPKIRPLWTIPSADGQVLTIYVSALQVKLIAKCAEVQAAGSSPAKDGMTTSSRIFKAVTTTCWPAWVR